jgi:hypothetical protein
MKKLLPSLLILLTAVSQVNAVSEAAVLFLLIQPSVRANGMGTTSVATSQHSPQSVSFNPAHVGFATFERSVNLEFYPSKTNWLPQFNIEDLTYDAKVAIVGYDLRGIHHKLPISIGIAYTKVNINLGQQTIVGETGPEPIATFNSSENAEVWSVGVAIDYYIKAGIGLNFKNIESNLSPIGAGGEIGTGTATASAHDFGILVQLPILEIFSKLTENTKNPYTIGNDLQPFVVPAFGFSKSNIGDEISYIDAAQADPLPRVARMGASLTAGMSYRTANTNMRLVSFEWSSEAEDFLVRRDDSGQITYEGGVGKIDFIENVLKSNANLDVINRRGWELSILNIISIRQGRYKDPEGKVFYDTSGFGISPTNLIRLTGLLKAELLDNSVVNFITNHVDIQYDHSSLDAQRGQPLDNTAFNGITIRLF